MVDNDPFPGQIHLRLKALVDANWASQREAAEAIGVPKSSLQRYLAGKSEPPNYVLQRIAEVLNLSQSYVFGFDDEPLPGLAPGQQRRPEMDLLRVSQLDVRAAAGHGAVNEHHAVEKTLAFPLWMLQKLGVSGHKLRFMRAFGDSMEPTFGNGALLLVDESDTRPPHRPPTPKNHNDHRDIFVFLIDGALRTKRLRLRGKEVFVISDNRAYDPEVLSGSELRHFEVLGRVIWWDDRL